VDKDRKEGPSYVEYTRLAGVGTQLVVSTLLGFASGRWLDGKLGTKPVLTIIFVLLGLAAGYLNVYRTVKKVGL
jgi:ATP synthase protein I